VWYLHWFINLMYFSSCQTKKKLRCRGWGKLIIFWVATRYSFMGRYLSTFPRKLLFKTWGYKTDAARFSETLVSVDETTQWDITEGLTGDIHSHNLAVFEQFYHICIIHIEHKVPFLSPPCTKFISAHNGTVFVTLSGCLYHRMFFLKISWMNF
jgi:hypothetical protein